MYMPPEADPEAVRIQSKQYSQTIYQDYKLLRTILGSHQQTVEKRWQKKSKQNKLKILIAAWGDAMPKGHRPDFDAFCRENAQQRKLGTRFRSSYMWPHINEEDLCKPNILPLMLHARASAPPSDFAALEVSTIHIGLVSEAIIPAFLNQHITLLNYQDEQSYGTLVHWDDHEDAFNWMHTQRQFIPGEALLVLECQERIMNFLVNCVKEILHDVSDTDLIAGGQTSVYLQPPQSTPRSFSTLRVMAEEAPYRRPADMDFSRVTSLMLTNYEAAKVCSLQRR